MREASWSAAALCRFCYDPGASETYFQRPSSFSRQLADLDATSYRTDAQAHAKSIAVAQHDFPAIGGSVRIEDDAFVELWRQRGCIGWSRLGCRCRLRRLRALVGSRRDSWLLAHRSDANLDSSIERAFATWHIFELLEIAAEFGLTNSLFKKIFPRPLIEFKPMNLIKTDRLA